MPKLEQELYSYTVYVREAYYRSGLYRVYYFSGKHAKTEADQFCKTVNGKTVVVEGVAT